MSSPSKHVYTRTELGLSGITVNKYTYHLQCYLEMGCTIIFMVFHSISRRVLG